MTPEATAHLQIWAGAITAMVLINLLGFKPVWNILRIVLLFLICQKSCYWCQGTGRIHNNKLCETCHGKGSINLFKSIFVK